MLHLLPLQQYPGLILLYFLNSSQLSLKYLPLHFRYLLAALTPLILVDTTASISLITHPILLVHHIRVRALMSFEVVLSF